MAQTSRNSLLSLGAILVIACFGLSYFITMPQWNKYSLAKNQLAQLQLANEQLNLDLASIQSFVEAFDSHQKDVATVSLALPAKSSDLANFLASLGDLAKSSGVVISNISLSENSSTETVPDNSIQVIPINLTASGSYASFKDFMVRVQSHLRLINVGHVTLKGDETGAVQYQISLKTYYQK